MTKFNNIKVKRVNSHLKYIVSKLVKKRPTKNEERPKKPLWYRYHAEKGNTEEGITQRSNTQKNSTQRSITQKCIEKKEICKTGITREVSLGSWPAS